jgi:hypothetical protein
MDRVGHPLIRIHLDLARLAPAVTRRQSEPQLAASRLGVTGRQASLAQKAQLIFRHRSLQAQQKPIIDQLWIIRTHKLIPLFGWQQNDPNA